MGFLPAEPDQVPVLYAPVRFGGRDHIYGFQNIGFTLRIISVEDVGTFRELHAQGLIVSEISKFK
jgi:hypothetical protein